ncbi:hypothetical protein LGQ02_05680 [Bacillus shivajii]|uniref:hypothetical protein n=1 Tax=Bacillus shivajii TaxID=1983719 RepID=UPI001CFA1E22|nr:hypothetical protein [Bacillus shivajii]UCZ54253.1 hypothetical protein LGQ02_05680 [Bacillus shivajii]
MFHRALFIQNFQQTKFIVVILFVLFAIQLPFQAFLSIENWRTQPISSIQQQHQFYLFEVFSTGVMTFLIIMSLVFLAALLIGIERNTRRNDFTFSLPFSRKDLFLAKWMYGAIIITIFHALHFTLAYFIIWQSEFRFILEHGTFTEIFFGPFLAYLLFYSFALFIGTITGEMISQVVLTFIFAGFPYGFYLLILAMVDVHFQAIIDPINWVMKITLFYYTIAHMTPGYDIIIPLFGVLILPLFGALLYERNKVEHNGEFLIFKQLNPIFLMGITVCFSLLGGILVSSIAPWNSEFIRIFAYWTGFLLFACFSYLLSKKILKMNVIVKNK